MLGNDNGLLMKHLIKLFKANCGQVNEYVIFYLYISVSIK